MMKNIILTLSRYKYLFKYTPKIQLFHRLMNPIKRPLTQKMSKYFSFKGVPAKTFSLTLKRKAIFDTEAIINGSFRFLNQEHMFQDEVDFKLRSKSLLWTFHLNYFDYLFDLESAYTQTKEKKYIDCANNLISSWIAQSHHYDSVMWSPYTVSLRLINWMEYVSKTEAFQSESMLLKVYQSIYSQYKYLQLNLENDVKGNHLIENLLTLVYADLYFSNHNQLSKDIRKLSHELSKQVYEDGMHEEKSFSYHILLTSKLHSLCQTLLESDIINEDFIHLVTLVNTMIDFISKNPLTLKNYPMFNDSNVSLTETINELPKKNVISQDHSTGYTHSNDEKSDYYKTKFKSYHLWMDLGKNGPDSLMAHAHNDSLSFVLMDDETPIFDDTGVFTYETGKWRQYARSVRAHNTMMINGFEPSDNWKSFIVGRRSIHLKPTLYENNDFLEWMGSYSFKINRKKYTHARKFKKHSDHLLIMDQVIGRGPLSVMAYFHLYPGLKYEMVNHQTFQITTTSKTLYFKVLNDYANKKILNGSLEPIQGWKFEGFGQKKSRDTLEMNFEGIDTLNISWLITEDWSIIQAIDHLTDISKVKADPSERRLER